MDEDSGADWPGEQCGARTTDDGTVVIYDESNASAWIESNVAVDFGRVHGVDPTA